MWHDTCVILGMCIDNVTFDECVSRIFAMIEDSKEDGSANYVATTNVDFLVNTHAIRMSRYCRPELLDALRYSEMMTADGMPLIWISKLLGCPIKERLTGADLVPILAAEAARQGKSMYFLGGKPGSGATTAGILKKKYPQLKINDVQLAIVEVEGEKLAESIESDRAVLDKINQSGADILLLSLGNPRQEIWFYRNRNKLNVAVSLGIGGSFEVLSGAVPRAPQWMQNSGLEWFFRFSQEPKRLWKRYLIGALRIIDFALPLIVYYTYRRIVFRLSSSRCLPQCIKYVSVSPNSSENITVLNLPALVDLKIDTVFDELLVKGKNASQIVLDFSQVKLIDPAGLGMLVQLIKKMRRNFCKLCLINISCSIKRYMVCNRIWDFFFPYISNSMDSIITGLYDRNNVSPFYYSFTEEEKIVTIYLLGNLLDCSVLEKIKNVSRNKHCVIDFSCCVSIENAGLKVLLELQDAFSKHDKKCVIVAISRKLKQALRIAEIDTLFAFARTEQDARQLLRD